MAYRTEDGQVIITTEDVRKGGFEVVPEPYNTQMNAGPIDNSDTGAQLDEAFRNSNSFLAEAYRKYTYSKADWAADADIYGKKLNISPDVLLNGGSDLIEKARKISSDMDRVGETIEMNTMYPELQKIKFASSAEAVTLLNNAKSVRSSYGIWDSLEQGYMSMNDQMKMADAGYQLAYTNDVAKREELFKEIERLKSNLNQYRTMGSNPIETVVGETAQQVYMMGKQIVRGTAERGVEGMALGMAAGAGIGTLFAGAGAVPGVFAGGITGLSTSIKVGTAEQMQHMSFGLKYLDLINKKDSTGRRIYSDEEARNRATAYSIVDTGIEYASLRVAGKAIKAAVPGTSALSKIMASEGLSETFRRGGLAVARNYVKTGVKTGGAELIEEGLQDINDKVQTNLFGKAGDDVYSATDIGLGAIQAMVDAAPAVLGLGILGGLGGSIYTASQFRAFNRMSPEQQQMVVQSEINTRGNEVLQAMVADGETNILAKNNPELYSKVIQAAADKRGIGQVYINVQDMINTEQGQVAVQNMVQNGYMTQEEVTKAIENDTSIEVPISQFAQANTKLEESTLKELENHVYYTEGGMSLHGIQKAVNTAKAMREHFSGEYAAKQDAVRHEIMKEFSENTEIEKEMADLVVGNNPYAIKRSFNELYNALEEEYKETYHEELTTPAPSESEQDVEPSTVERPRFVTTSIGDVKPHTKMGARRLAFNQAKNRVMENFTDGMSEGAQKVALARYEEMEGKLQRLEAMDKIKDRLFTIAEGDVYVRSNLSPEGYEVYQDMITTLKQGNVAMVKSAKENALVFASHADVVANIMQRAGYREYTAKDYVEQYIKVNARDVTPVEGGYAQAKLAQEKLEQHTKLWQKTIESLKDKTISVNKPLFVMDTPLVFSLVDSSIEFSTPIEMDVSIFNKIVNGKHSQDVSFEALASLPKALADPVMILQNINRKGEIREGVIVVLDLEGANGNIQVPIKLSVKSGRHGKRHAIMTMFSREESDWYTNALLNQGVLYVNKKKSRQVMTAIGQSSSQRVTLTTSYMDSIPNEADLRNLKDGNPTYYQKNNYEKDLIAYHNLSENSLRKVLELGGLAVPSIAVTKKDVNYEGFGDITLVMNPSVVDPAQVPVFTRDAWTGVFPEAKHRVNTKAVVSFIKRLSKASKLIDGAKISKYETEYANYWTLDNAARYVSQMLSDVESKYTFLDSIGKAPAVIMKRNLPQKSILEEATFNNQAKGLLAKYGDTIYEYESMAKDDIIAYMRAVKKFEAQRDGINRFAAHRLKIAQTDYESYVNSFDDFKLWNEFVSNIVPYIGKEEALVRDNVATREAIENQITIHEKAYSDWVANMAKELLGEPLIEVKGKLKPITLENVVLAMKGELQNAQESNLGVGIGKVLAANAKQPKSLGELHREADKRISVEAPFADGIDTNDAYEDVKKKITEYRDLMYEQSKYYREGMNYNPSIGDDALQVLIEVQQKGKSFENSAKKFGFIPTVAIKAMAEEIIQNIDALKVQYFEAKPQRAIGFNEVSVAIVPNNLEKDLKEKLQTKGVSIAIYNPNIKGDRQRVSKEVQGKYTVLFQKFKAGEVKGLTSMYEDGRRLVQLFETADFSTFIHESGHVFLEDLRMLATMDGAPEDVIADWHEIKKWTGYEEGADADTNRAAHEKFARGFEAYLREGKAPTKLLERTFRRFKQWLTAIYHSVTSLGGLPPKKVQDVMSRMLAVQTEIDSYTAQQGLDSFERSKIYSGMAGEEQAQFMVLIDDVREGAKENVLKAYMKELDGRAEKVWEEQKETIRRDLKEYYVERYPVYAARVIYDNFGEAGLINTEYKTVNELEMGEAQALGNWHELIEREMQTAKESLTETYSDSTEIRKMADEYLLSNEGQQKVAMAEAEAVKKFTNRSIAANYELIATLNTMEVITPETIQSVVRAIEKKADKSTVAKVKSVAKKFLAEPNNNVANEKVVNALKDALQEYISNMRALRNLSVGDVDTMMEKAHDSLKKLPVSKAVSFKQYQNKSVTSARLSDIALAKGKMDEAFYHKQQQLFMQAMARAAYENAEEQRKLEQDLKKKYTAISRPKNPKRIKPEARYFIGHLLYQIGMVNRDATLPSEGFILESIYSLLDTDVELMQQAGSIKLEQWIIDVFNQGKKWNKLTFEELGDLHQIVVAVYTRGLSEYESTTLLDENGKLVTFDEAVAQMIEQGQQRLTVPAKDLLTLDNEKGKVGAAKNKIATLMMDLIKPEVILRRFDDDKVGPWVRYVYDPIDRATRKGKEMFEVATRRLSSTLGIYSKKELYYLRTERMYNLGTVYSMTKEQVISLALNWGTKNNRQRVRETLQIENDVEVERYFAQYLDNKDWDFIESVWDFINSYYEERSAVQERLYGAPLHKVRTLDFTINGRKIKGQYYPIVYDPRMDGDSKGYEVEDIIRSQMSSNAVWGMGMSATKNRVQQVKGRKLMLSFDVIPRAIDEAINHIAMREAAIDVNKLLSQKELANYITAATGVETLQLLKKWVRDNWQAEIVRTTKWDRYLQTVKSNTTFAIMAYRTSTALLNILNIVPMMYEQGVRKSLMAIGRFYLHVNPEKIKKNREFVENHSVFIRERRYNLDKDMKEGLKVGQDGITYFANDDIGRKISEGKQVFEDTRDWINNYGYSFITETDLLLSMPLWKMVYDEKIAEYVEDDSLSAEFIESKAVSEADRAVRRVFGSGETKDSADIQRSRNSITALFTPFYTYANTVFNALVEGGYAAYDKRDYGKLFNAILYWVLIQGLAEGTLRAMMDDEEDDLLSWIKKVGSATVSGGLGGLPYIRDAFGLVYNLMVGEPSYSRGNEAVALSAIPKMIDLGRTMSKESSSWIDVMRIGGQITNRFIGFSDTLSDGFWTLAKWSLMDTDATVTDLMKAIIFDRKIKTKEEQRKSKK